MKEDLFKKILILALLLNNIIFGTGMNSMAPYNYIPIDFMPYNASKTSVGMNLYKHSYSNYELIAHNWFTDNLYFSGSFRPISVENDIRVKYNVSLGYSSNFSSTFFKSLSYNLSYQRLRYQNSINDNYKGILYYLLLTIKIKSIWIFPSYGKVDDEYKTNQYGFGILKSFNNKILVTFGLNGYLNDGREDVVVPYISLRYNI